MKTHIGTAFNFQRSLAPDANAEKPISLPTLLWNISWWVLVFQKIWKRNTVFAPCPSEKTTKFLSWKDNTRETKEKSLKFTDLDGASMLKNSPNPRLTANLSKCPLNLPNVSSQNLNWIMTAPNSSPERPPEVPEKEKNIPKKTSKRNDL